MVDVGADYGLGLVDQIIAMIIQWRYAGSAWKSN